MPSSPTPVAYLIDRTGLIAADVAVGVDCVLDLLCQAKQRARQPKPARTLRAMPKLFSLVR